MYRPKLTPPTIVFRIIWPILYLILFITFYFYVRGPTLSIGLVTFFLQLLFNLVWYPIMFLAEMPRLALLDLFFLLVMLITMIVVWPSPLNILNIPYLLWSIFAFYLNAEIAFHP
jgi:tryptophan-rich sensory protein